MFETLVARATRAAERRAREAAERIAEDLPGTRVEPTGDGARISGPRWTMEGLKR